MTNGVAVSAAKCAEWRRKARRGYVVKWFAEDEDEAYVTVRYHVNGECSCPTDVAPMERGSK